MGMLTLSRPAKVLSDTQALDAEYRSLRWAYHRLLDFEDQHQRVLDAAAERAAPGIVRVGRIVSRLARRARRATRTAAGTWCPDPRPALAAEMKQRLEALRRQRDAAPEWKAAKGWADERVGAVVRPRRKATETDAEYAERCAVERRRTRRDEYRVAVYPQRRCFHGAWVGVCNSVDQARKDVVKRRAKGVSARWRRPSRRDPGAIRLSGSAMKSGFRIVERGRLWWVVEIRIGRGSDWARVKAKCGNWHDVETDPKSVTLTRRLDGERWAYTLGMTFEGVEKRANDWADEGVVAFDWGHREHGHATATRGVRAFVWKGDDGREGEVLVPRACREALDRIDDLKSRLDTAWAARKKCRGLRDKNRHTYRRRLMRQGTRTGEEARWLQWEMRYERRIAAAWKRVRFLRKEAYLKAVQTLRKRYKWFGFEGIGGEGIKAHQKDDEMARRARSNRDLVARFEFVSICERFGAELVTVSARNTSRECPSCGHLGENGPDVLIECPACGTVRDKDQGAAMVILRRTEEALAPRAAE